MRMELQAHIQQHHHMLSGYTDYLTRRAHVLLSLVRTDPTAELPTVTAAEFDRLALLLRPALPGSPLSSDGAAPMDIHSPINSTTGAPHLPAHAPFDAFILCSTACKAAAQAGIVSSFSDAELRPQGATPDP